MATGLAGVVLVPEPVRELVLVLALAQVRARL